MCTRTALALLVVITVAGCSMHQSAGTMRLPREGRWVLLPIANRSQTPQAGEQVESMIATLLRARGVAVTSYPPPSGDHGLPILDDERRFQEVVRWAVEEGYEYGFTGSVEEWQYNGGRGGDPVVGLSLRVVRLPQQETLWSSTGARSGWGRGSLLATGQKLAGDLLRDLPLR